MNGLEFYKQFAVAYNCNAYGVDTYNNNNSCTISSISSSASSQTTDFLSNTGTSMYLGIGLGILLIVCSIILIVKNNKRQSN